MSANRWPGISDQAATQIEAAVVRGNKIEAIKIYRQETHCGLKEAKDAIEANASEFSERRSETQNASGPAQRSGPSWLTMVLVLIVLGVLLTAFLFALR